MLNIKKIYDQYPRRYGKSKKIIYSKEEFIFNVNRDNGFGDVFISVFPYTRLKEVEGTYKIDSSSAILDKVFIDIDFKDFIDYDEKEMKKFALQVIKKSQINNFNKKDKVFIKKFRIKKKLTTKQDKQQFLNIYEKINKKSAEEACYKLVISLETFLDEREALRIWVFTGGGFHIYIYIEDDPKNKKIFYKNCVDYLSKNVCTNEEYSEANIRDGEIVFKSRVRKLWDPHCPPKLSQMARVIGTYNPRRKLFCTSLTKEDLKKGMKHIKNKAKKPNMKINYLGKKPMRFGNTFDTNDCLETCNLTHELDIKEYPKNLSDLLNELGILLNEIPPCILRLLKENKELGYLERYFLITFLYRVGLSKKEIIEVLKIILLPKKLYHCCGTIKNNYKPTAREKSRREYQIESIIENDYYISCSQIQNHGLCVSNCETKDVLYYFS